MTRLFKARPRRLFLVDGAGALVSAFLLGLVLARLDFLFGIPARHLYLLALLPLVFAACDLLFFFAAGRTALFLRVMAVLNLSYCLLSAGFAVFHRDTMTTLGWTYLLAEWLIVALLAALEIRTAGLLRAAEGS